MLKTKTSSLLRCEIVKNLNTILYIISQWRALPLWSAGLCKISLTPTTLSNSTTKPTKMHKYKSLKSQSSLTSISLVNSKNKANSCLSALVPLRLVTSPFVSFESKKNFLWKKKLLNIQNHDYRKRHLFSFIGWAGLTYLWLETNRFFFSTVINSFLRKKESCGACNDSFLVAKNILNGKTCANEFLVHETACNDPKP